MINIDSDKLEKHFWAWWDLVGDRKGLLNARQAFEAGYYSAMKEMEK